MKVLFAFVLAIVIFEVQGAFPAKCLKKCKEALYCPPCPCPKGLITVRDPCGCVCPTCECPKELQCSDSKLPKGFCPALPCEFPVYDPCGCACPFCSDLVCPYIVKGRSEGAYQK